MESQERKQLYTNFISKKDFRRLIYNASTEYIESFSRDVRYQNDMSRVTIADGFSYIDCVAKKYGWEDAVRKIFLQCWLQAESLILSSGNIALYFLAQKFIGGKDKSLLDLNRSVVYATKDISFESLSQLLESEVFDFVKEVIEFGGINGTISIEKTQSSIGAIELRSGHNFLIGMNNNFVSEKEKRDEAKIVLFDGIIQDVSEVDRIFIDCNEKKISCVLVARGFGNDVMSTINKNYHRKTLDIIPIKVDDSIKNINLFNDMSACIGKRVIDSESGIRLSNVNIQDEATISNISLSKKHFKFSAISENKLAVDSRIESIKDRISKAHWDDEMSHDDIQKVFIPRLDSLSSNSVILWLPGKERIQLSIKNRFLFSLNYIAAFANSGAIKTSDIFGKKHNLPNFLPSNIVDVSKSLSEKIHLSISSAGGCVAIQRT